MKKLLTMIGAIAITAPASASVVAFSPTVSNVQKINFDDSNNIIVSNETGNWNQKGEKGGNGQPVGGVDSDGNLYAYANADGGTHNNSYAHVYAAIDFSSKASNWNDFVSKYAYFAFEGKTTITGDYARSKYNDQLINNCISPNNENLHTVLETSLLTDMITPNKGFLNQTNDGGGSRPTIETNGWNDWWRAGGKKKIARSQAWGGSTALAFWHDDQKVYINIAADFRNGGGTYHARGHSEISISKIMFIKK